MNISKIKKYLLTKYSIGAIIAAVLFTLNFFTYSYLDTSLQENNLVLKNISMVQDSVFQLKYQFQSFVDEKTLVKRNLLKRKLDQQFADIKNNNIILELTFHISIKSNPPFKRELKELKREIQEITIDYRSLSAETKLALQAPFFGKINDHIMNIHHSLSQLSLLVSFHHQKIVSDFSRYNLLIWLASLLCLHLIIIFIFKPASKKIISVIEDLSKEKEEAHSIAQAKSDYLATMSYQIRTPLNGVLGLSALLLETNINKEQREYLELVLNSGENLLQVINNIFDYSKIEAGNLDLEEIYFSLHQSLKEIVTTYLPRCKEKKLELIYIIEHDVPEFIFGDPQRIFQCLSNLLDNAIKFTREGEIFIRVNLISSFDNKYEIQFAISDTGMGIPEEKQKTLFNPMPQSKAPVARRFEGTGLGLAIVSRIVQLMNGRIWVESEINIRTTFFIAISFQGKETGSPIKNRENIDSLNQKHVLILNGNESDRKMLSIQCHNWGMQPRTFSTSDNFFNAVNNERHVDCFIIENDLLSENNYEMLNTIRKKEAYNNTPIVYIDSMENDTLKKRGLIYLSKPVEKNQFLDILLQCTNSQDTNYIGKVNISNDTPKLHLLLAEDNMINQKLMQRMVSQLGYTLDIAQDGNQAVKMATTNVYDVIFMDLQMPEIDGIEATKKILLNASEPKPKIVAMTANVDQRDKELCFEAGMIDYYAKPIGFNNIKKLLSHWESVK